MSEMSAETTGSCGHSHECCSHDHAHDHKPAAEKDDKDMTEEDWKELFKEKEFESWEADEKNRTTLKQWVEEKLAQYDGDASLAKKKAAKFGSRVGYKANLEASCAEKLAGTQRRRQAQLDAAFLPDGVCRKASEEYGNALYNERPFRRFDTVLVEGPALVVEHSGTVSEDRKDMERMWKAQLKAFAGADTATQERVLGMFAAAPEELPAAIGKHLLKFAKANAKDLKVGEAAAVRVPLVFLANACEWHRGHALPIVGSLLAHSCTPSCLRQVDGMNGSLPGKAEFVANRDLLRVDQLLTVDYLGHPLWCRSKRQAALKETKNFVCKCERCARADLESAVVCPACYPLDHRQMDFALPAPVTRAPDAANIGYVVRIEGSDLKWQCTNEACGANLTSNAVDQPITSPQCPARSYLGLEQYCVDLVKDLDPSDCDRVPESTLKELLTPILACVGWNHWTVHTVRLALLVVSSDPDVVLENLQQLWRWLKEWCGLDPVLYIGPQRLIQAINKIFSAGKKQDVKLYLDVMVDDRTGVPKCSQIFQAAAGLLANIK